MSTDAKTRIFNNLPQFIKKRKTALLLHVLDMAGTQADALRTRITTKKTQTHIATATSDILDTVGESYGLDRMELETDEKYRARISEAVLHFQEMGALWYIENMLLRINGINDVEIIDSSVRGFVMGEGVLGVDILRGSDTTTFEYAIYIYYDKTIISSTDLEPKVVAALSGLNPAHVEYTDTYKDKTYHKVIVNDSDCQKINMVLNALNEVVADEPDAAAFVAADTIVTPTVTELEIEEGLKIKVETVHDNLYYYLSFDGGSTWGDAVQVFDFYSTKNGHIEIETIGEEKRIKITFNRYNWTSQEWDEWEGYIEIYMYVLKKTQTAIAEAYPYGIGPYGVGTYGIDYVDATSGNKINLNYFLSLNDFFKIKTYMRTTTDPWAATGWTNWLPVTAHSGIPKSINIQLVTIVTDKTLHKDRFWHRKFVIKN